LSFQHKAYLDSPYLRDQARNQLPFRLDFGDNPMDGIDIDSGFQLKAELSGSSIFSISDYYKGKFDPDKIEVRIKDKKCRSKR